jgi:hypothetical protein
MASTMLQFETPARHGARIPHFLTAAACAITQGPHFETISILGLHACSVFRP